MEDQKKSFEGIKKLDEYYAQLYNKREKINTTKLEMCAKYDEEMKLIGKKMATIDYCKTMKVDDLEDHISRLQYCMELMKNDEVAL